MKLATAAVVETDEGTNCGPSLEFQPWIKASKATIWPVANNVLGAKGIKSPSTVGILS